MKVEPQDYQARVLSHLQKYRPQQVAAAKKDGSLNDQVQSLSTGIADWVNSQLPSEESLQGLSPQDRAKQMNQATMFAESEALRELLPRDEESEKQIGPTGGYEDRTTVSPTTI